jgi:hypothetical protein
VEELISNSQLNIASEEKVFTAVMNWVKHDLANREQHVAQVGVGSDLLSAVVYRHYPIAP